MTEVKRQIQKEHVKWDVRGPAFKRNHFASFENFDHESKSLDHFNTNILLEHVVFDFFC